MKNDHIRLFKSVLKQYVASFFNVAHTVQLFQ